MKFTMPGKLNDHLAQDFCRMRVINPLPALESFPIAYSGFIPVIVVNHPASCGCDSDTIFLQDIRYYYYYMYIVP